MLETFLKKLWRKLKMLWTRETPKSTGLQHESAKRAIVTPTMAEFQAKSRFNRQVSKDIELEIIKSGTVLKRQATTSTPVPPRQPVPPSVPKLSVPKKQVPSRPNGTCNRNCAPGSSCRTCDLRNSSQPASTNNDGFLEDLLILNAVAQTIAGFSTPEREEVQGNGGTFGGGGSSGSWDEPAKEEKSSSYSSSSSDDSSSSISYSSSDSSSSSSSDSSSGSD